MTKGSTPPREQNGIESEKRVIPGSSANSAWTKTSVDSKLDMSLGMTTEELAEHSRRERETTAAEIQLPKGGEGTMEAFEMGAGTSVAGTMVEEDDRTTTGKSVAQSRYSIKDGSLGSFGCSEYEDDTSNSDEENAMVIEIPTGGLEGITDSGDMPPLRGWSEKEDGMISADEESTANQPLLPRQVPEDEESAVKPTKLNLEDDGEHKDPANQQLSSGQRPNNTNTTNTTNYNRNTTSNNSNNTGQNNNHSNTNSTDPSTNAAKRYYDKGPAGKATLLAWHTSTNESALKELGNTYAIIGNFPRFQRGADDEEDTVRGRCRVAGMIADFGGKPTGSEVTIDTNYVVVGATPLNAEHRKTFEAQLKEARELELPLASINGIMKRIGVEASNITDDNGNIRKPLYVHEQAGKYSYNMYKSRSAEEEITFSTDTAAASALAEVRTNAGASEVKEAGHQLEDEYDRDYYRDSDGEVRERSEGTYQSEDSYHQHFYRDSDGEVRERGEETEYQPDDLSEYAENLSIGSNDRPVEQRKAAVEMQPAPPAPHTSTSTNMTSSSPSSGDGDQATTPAPTEKKGTPSPLRAPEAGAGSSSSGAG